MRYIIYDAETKSRLSLKLVGAHQYARDPSTDVWCVSYCVVDNGERGAIKTWLPGDPIPAEILTGPELTVAFNDQFERLIEGSILHPRYGWPVFPIERRRDAQAVALTYALPAKLEAIAKALKLPLRKSAEGMRAMKKLAAPRRPRKGEDPAQTYWHDDRPDLLAQLYAYNRIDVEITAEISRLLGFIPAGELPVYALNSIINDRGIHLDRGLLDAAVAIADQADDEIIEKITTLTGGEITGPAQTQRILGWLAQHGCAVPNVQAETLQEALKRPDLSGPARELITLRLDGAQAAVDKFRTLQRWLNPDDRVCGVFRYHGAMPGRFTSMGAQMQNLKKPALEDPASAIEAVGTGRLAHLRERYQRPLEVVGDITRAMIKAAPGHRLFIADLSGIESRGLAWITNEETKLAAWREFDRTGNPEDEPYLRFAREIGVTTNPRGTGKTGDLAFQYQGGIGAWRRLAPADDTPPDDVVWSYQRAWHLRHPNIKRFWTAAIEQAVKAIESPGQRVPVARLAFQRDGHFLRLELPSGRNIHYPFARPYEDRSRENRSGRTFTFLDNNQGRWEWYHVLKEGRGAFGGLIAENATQALCRDIFVEAMLRLEAAGYHIVAHFHDEFVCEVPDDFGDLDEFKAIITQPPAWAADFPIACKARISDRFIEIKPKTAPEPPPLAGKDALVEEPAAETIEARASIPFMITREMKLHLAGLGYSAEQVFNMTPVQAHEALLQAGAMPPPPPIAIVEPPKAAPPPPPNGHEKSAHTGAQPNGAWGNYDNRDDEKDGAQPYAPIKAALLRKGYRLAQSFPYRLPGRAEALFYEDRYELRPGLTPTKERPRKQCRYRHRDRNDQDFSDTGPRRIVYNWPPILDAGPGAPVFIAEGANKCNPLIEKGLLATAAPYHQWGPECVQALAGRPLIYLEDHDHPDERGRIKAKELSADAQRHLAPVAASFRIVPGIRLWKNLGRQGEPPHGWDVKDWLKEGGNAAELIDICEAEPETERVDPVDLWGHFDPPALPAGLLPAAIEQFAAEEAEMMGADPAGLAIAALTVCAAALPDRIKLQVKKHDRRWKESTRLWTAVVGGVSAKKTPIVDRATHAIKKLDWDLAREHESAMEVYAQLTKEEQKKHKPPLLIRLVLEDCTIEAAQEIFKGNTDGMLKVHDELAGFFGAMERYNSGAGNSNRAFYLQAYNGGRHLVDRISRGTLRFDNLSITVLGGIQPEVMRKIAANSIEDGLIQRICPIMVRDAEVGQDKPGGQAAERYDALVASLRAEQPGPEPLQFDGAARPVREELERQHAKLQRYYAAFNRRLAAHIGKYDGLFARLCLLWHYIEGANTPAISERTASRVASFMHKFLLPHAITFYTSILGISDNHDSISQLAGYILAKRLTRITSREVQRSTGGPSGLRRQDVETFCDQLESLGWLFRVQGPRRDSVHWDVNPEVHRKFAERAARETAERAERRASIMGAAASAAGRHTQAEGDDGEPARGGSEGYSRHPH